MVECTRGTDACVPQLPMSRLLPLVEPLTVATDEQRLELASR